MLIFLLACNPSTDKELDPGHTDPDRPGPETATYYQDVAPILANNCVSCHREDGSGPFPLDHYEMAKATAGMIEDSVTTRRMPPFHANNSGECGTFEHSLWLTDTEITTIANWVAGNTLRRRTHY